MVALTNSESFSWVFGLDLPIDDFQIQDHQVAWSSVHLSHQSTLRVPHLDLNDGLESWLNMSSDSNVNRMKDSGFNYLTRLPMNQPSTFTRGDWSSPGSMAGADPHSTLAIGLIDVFYILQPDKRFLMSLNCAGAGAILEAPFWGQNGTSKAQTWSVFKAI